jgi:hypothetical protein
MAKELARFLFSRPFPSPENHDQLDGLSRIVKTQTEQLLDCEGTRIEHDLIYGNNLSPDTASKTILRLPTLGKIASPSRTIIWAKSTEAWIQPIVIPEIPGWFTIPDRLFGRRALSGSFVKHSSTLSVGLVACLDRNVDGILLLSYSNNRSSWNIMRKILPTVNRSSEVVLKKPTPVSFPFFMNC